jgi:hypothetical protein
MEYWRMWYKWYFHVHLYGITEGENTSHFEESILKTQILSFVLAFPLCVDNNIQKERSDSKYPSLRNLILLILKSKLLNLHVSLLSVCLQYEMACKDIKTRHSERLVIVRVLSKFIRLTTLPPSCGECLEILGASTSLSLKFSSRPACGWLYNIPRNFSE